jgi:hypothetical protein
MLINFLLLISDTTTGMTLLFYSQLPRLATTGGAHRGVQGGGAAGLK